MRRYVFRSRHRFASMVACCAVLLHFSATRSEAATLAGSVRTADNVAVAGAMVTVFGAQGARKETVFTDAAGAFWLQTSLSGHLRIRVRTPFFVDLVTDRTIAPDDVYTETFVTGRRKSITEQSDAAPASVHVATLPWPEAERRADFISQCNYCHQVGNPLTRRPRSRAEWVRTVRRMQGYGAVLTRDQATSIIETLHKGFTGKPVRVMYTPDYHDELAQTKIEEWLVGDGLSFIHDAEVGSDGHLYGADEGHDIIWELDPASGAVTRHQMPDPGLPTGGRLSAFPLPLGIFTGKHGPHSLAEDAEGRFWITNALSSYLLSFDIRTKQFRQYNVGHEALYPHTVRIDKSGVVWFTIAITNQLARFDPKTETFTIVDLPTTSWKQSLTYEWLPHLAWLFAHLPIDLKSGLHPDPGEAAPTGPLSWMPDRGLLNLPYGLDISPIDGRIWYSKLYGNKIGVLDPATLQVREYDTPLKGPRRLRFDATGILWIPSFDEGAIMRFDPEREAFRVFELPALADDQWETPYALNIHPRTGDVWITSNNSDRLFRFTPATARFVSYPSPTRVTFLRDLVFTESGKVCSSQSNLPAYAIEDGRPSFICIDPDGNLGGPDATGR